MQKEIEERQINYERFETIENKSKLHAKYPADRAVIVEYAGRHLTIARSKHRMLQNY
jgi:hypothetical protein